MFGQKDWGGERLRIGSDYPRKLATLSSMKREFHGASGTTWCAGPLESSRIMQSSSGGLTGFGRSRRRPADSILEFKLLGAARMDSAGFGARRSTTSRRRGTSGLTLDHSATDDLPRCRIVRATKEKILHPHPDPLPQLSGRGAEPSSSVAADPTASSDQRSLLRSDAF